LKEISLHTVSYRSDASHLSQIELWLTEELKLTGEGYKHNWEIILAAHKQGCMAVLLEGDIAIGFAIWRELTFHIRLDIFCIEMRRRKKGYGKLFFTSLVQEFKSQQKFAIELQCSPADSEPYWRFHGFTDLHSQNIVTPRQNLWLYRPVVDVAPQCEQQPKGDYLSLWDTSPDFANAAKLAPRKSFAIEYEKDRSELKNPIVVFCQPDWQVNLISDGEIIQSSKAKYFEEGSYADRMLVITAIKK
jgi:hypothetical protein